MMGGVLVGILRMDVRRHQKRHRHAQAEAE